MQQSLEKKKRTMASRGSSPERACQRESLRGLVRRAAVAPELPRPPTRASPPASHAATPELRRPPWWRRRALPRSESRSSCVEVSTSSFLHHGCMAATGAPAPAVATAGAAVPQDHEASTCGFLRCRRSMAGCLLLAVATWRETA